MSYSDAKNAILVDDLVSFEDILSRDATVVDDVDESGNSLLHVAVRAKSAGAVELLLRNHRDGSYGLILTKKNHEGATALALALESFQKPLAKKIVDAAIERKLATDFVQLEETERRRNAVRRIIENMGIENAFLEIQIEQLDRYLRGEYSSSQETIDNYYCAISEEAEALFQIYGGMAGRKSSSDLGDGSGSDFERQKIEKQKLFKTKLQSHLKRCILPDPAQDDGASDYWKKERLSSLVEFYRSISSQSCAGYMDGLLEERDGLEEEQRELVEKFESDKAILLKESHRVVEAANPKVLREARSQEHISNNLMGSVSVKNYEKVSFEGIVLLLRAGFPVDMPDFSINTLLHWSIMYQSEDNVLVLTEFPWRANLNVLNGLGKTPLELALVNKNIAALLRRKSLEYLGFEAIVEKSVDKLRMTIERGVHINVSDDNANTLLHAAAHSVVYQNNSIDLVRVLVQEGADRNALNAFKQTPIEYAGEKALLIPELVELLQPSNMRCGAFQLLAEEVPNMDALKEIFLAGLNVDVRDDYGRTLLYIAAEGRSKEVIEFLIDEGASAWIPDQNGIKPYDVLEENHPELLDLLEKRASQDQLFFAVKVGYEELVEKTLESYPKLVDKKDWGGTPPLFYSVLYGHNRISKLLLEKGADYLMENSHGRTPVHAALQTRNVELLDLLDVRWIKDVGSNLISYQDEPEARGNLAVQLKKLFSLQYCFSDPRKGVVFYRKMFSCLDLRGLPLKSDTLLDIFSFLRRGSGIINLNLSRKSRVATSDRVISSLVKLISSESSHITHLDLSRTGLTQKHVEPLIRIISSGKLRSLNISRNFFFNKHIKVLLQAYENEPVPELELNFNYNSEGSWQIFDTYQGISARKRVSVLQADSKNQYYEYPSTETPLVLSTEVQTEGSELTFKQIDSIGEQEENDRSTDHVAIEIHPIGEELLVLPPEDEALVVEKQKVDIDNEWFKFILQELQPSNAGKEIEISSGKPASTDEEPKVILSQKDPESGSGEQAASVEETDEEKEVVAVQEDSGVEEAESVEQVVSVEEIDEEKEVIAAQEDSGTDEAESVEQVVDAKETDEEKGAVAVQKKSGVEETESVGQAVGAEEIDKEKEVIAAQEGSETEETESMGQTVGAEEIDEEKEAVAVQEDFGTEEAESVEQVVDAKEIDKEKEAVAVQEDTRTEEAESVEQSVGVEEIDEEKEVVAVQEDSGTEEAGIMEQVVGIEKIDKEKEAVAVQEDSGTEEAGIMEQVVGAEEIDKEKEAVAIQEDSSSKEFKGKEESIEDSTDPEENIASLFHTLQTIHDYNGKRDGSDADLTSDYIYDTLNQQLPKNVHVVHPEYFCFASPVSAEPQEFQDGAFRLASALIGWEKTNLSEEDQPPLSHSGIFDSKYGVSQPVIIPIPDSSSYLEQGEGNGSSFSSSSLLSSGISCEHWVLMVILPRNYITIAGEPLDNDEPYLFFINSVNLNQKLPGAVLDIFQKGAERVFSEGGIKFKETVKPLLPKVKCIFNADLERQQKKFTRDCGVFVLYNAFMICLTGNADFIVHDNDRRMATALRAIFPVAPILGVNYQKAESKSTQASYESFEEKHSGDEAVVEVDLQSTSAQEDALPQHQGFIFDSFIILTDYLVSLSGEFDQSIFGEEFTPKGDKPKIVILDYIIFCLIKQIRVLQEEFKEEFPQAALEPRKFSKENVNYLAKLANFYEELMRNSWANDPQFYKHSFIINLYYIIRVNLDSFFQYSGLQLEGVLEQEFSTDNVRGRFIETMFSSLKTLASNITYVNNELGLNLAGVKNKKKFAASMFTQKIVPSLHMMKYKGLDPFIDTERMIKFHGESRLKRVDQNRLDLMRSACEATDLVDQLAAQEIQRLSGDIFTLEDINVIHTMLRGEARLGKCLVGLYGAFGASRNKEKTFLEEIFENLAVRFSEIYKEQIMLLDKASVDNLAKFIAYHISDFCAVCGDSIRKVDVSVLIKSLLCWTFYGRSRRPVNLKTRLGDTVDCYTLLQKSGLKFKDPSGEVVRLNVMLPDQGRQQGECWGCRMATPEEQNIVSQYMHPDHPEYGKIAYLCFSHTEREDLIPAAEEVLEVFKTISDAFEPDPEALKPGWSSSRVGCLR